jgi:hypothetical protein
MAFPYAGLRLRFHFRATTTDRVVQVAVNATEAGTGGLHATVSTDTGELAVLDGSDALGSQAAGELDTDTDYFVELLILGSELSAVLSTGDYASEPGAVEVVRVEVSSFEAEAPREFLTIGLSSSEIGIDEVSVARCGAAPPAYTPLFRDTFTRPDSSTIGNAELPATSTWSDDADASIVGGAVSFTDAGGIQVGQGEHYEDSWLLRVRATLRFGVQGWFTVLYNGAGGGVVRGFDIWRQDDETTRLRGQEYAFALTLDTDYYLEFNAFESYAVLTVRQDSYAGPILGAHAIDDLVSSNPDGTSLQVNNSYSLAEFTIEELRIDQYAP